MIFLKERVKRKKKRIGSILLVLIVVLSFAGVLTACSSSDKIPIPKVEENVFVYDEDNVIDDDVEESINDILVDLEEKTGTEFAVISVESLLNRSIEEYANNLFNTLGIGKKGEDNGVLLLFSRSDERVRLEIGRGLEGCLNDSKCGRILDDYFVPYREDDKYTEAAENTVKAVVSVIAEEYEVSIQGVDDIMVADEENNEDTPLLLVIVIIVIIAFFVIGLVLAIIYGDDSSGSSGGFFGGSSGGFSGGSFGGGFSGGGGASR